MRRFAVLLNVPILACLTSDPSTSPMDIRAAPGDTGTLSGQVRVAAAGGLVPGRIRVPGTTVELGRWRGNAVDFQDVVSRHSADDPRFHVVVSAIADDSGSFRLDGLPMQTIFSLRARPPAGAPYRVTYVDSLFTVSNMRWVLVMFQPNPSR